MRLNGRSMRTIWLNEDGWSVAIIDQTLLPHQLETVTLRSVGDAAHAIKSMQVRGAPLIGATAAYGMALAMRADASNEHMNAAAKTLIRQRPTAVNLRWAVNSMVAALKPLDRAARAAAAYAAATSIADDDVDMCRRIGVNGLDLIRELSEAKGGAPVNILTHCNAGWLACVDWGTATSPIYHAHDAGIAVHVFVDETRPRNQGAALTAFELQHHGVPHALIVDNAGGHFMQTGDIDMVIVGSDRVTANGDVVNKIGTYLKALAARDNDVPFYVAIPHSTIDWATQSGTDVEIEDRGPDEVLNVRGRDGRGDVVEVAITATGTPARNPGFDVTPHRLVTGLITERGVCPASAEGLLDLYPERRSGGYAVA